MLIFLAGLQTIDPTLYEAAAIDGAGGFQKLVHVTLPGLRKILFFCFIVETIGSLQIFAEPCILTKGGPENSSLSIAMYRECIPVFQVRLCIIAGGSAVCLDSARIGGSVPILAWGGLWWMRVSTLYYQAGRKVWKSSFHRALIVFLLACRVCLREVAVPWT